MPAEARRGCSRRACLGAPAEGGGGGGAGRGEDGEGGEGGEGRSEGGSEGGSEGSGKFLPQGLPCAAEVYWSYLHHHCYRYRRHGEGGDWEVTAEANPND